MKWLHILQTLGPVVAMAAGAPPALVGDIVQAAAAAEGLYTAIGSGADKLEHVQAVVQAAIAINNSIKGAPQLDPVVVNASIAKVVPAIISTVNAIHAAQQ